MPRETREPPKRAATDLSTGPSGPDIAEPERPSFWSQLWVAIRHFCKRANNSKVNFAGGEIFSTPYLKFCLHFNLFSTPYLKFLRIVKNLSKPTGKARLLASTPMAALGTTLSDDRKVDTTRSEAQLEQTSAEEKLPTKTRRMDGAGNQGDATERSHSGNLRRGSQLTNFYSAEEGQRRQEAAGAQLTVDQRAHPQAEVQDADHEGGQAGHFQRRVHGKDRPEGHVLANSGSSSRPSLPSFPLGRKELLFQGAPDGPHLEPNGSDQGFQTSGGQASGDGPPGSHLHRRPSDSRQNENRVRSSGPGHSGAFGLLGGYNQLGKILSDPFSTNHLSRFRDQLCRDDHQGTVKQDQEYQKGAEEVPQSRPDLSARNSLDSGQNQQFGRCNFSGEDSYERTPRLQEQDSQRRILELNDAQDSRSDRGLQMVDSEPFSLEWKVPDTHTYGPASWYGCFGRTVGRLDPDWSGGSDFRRIFHEGRGEPSHQRKRTVGDQLLDRMRSRELSGPFSTNRFGQHNGGSLFEPIRGPNTAAGFYSSDNLGETSSTQLFHQSFLPSWGGERTGRFSITQPRPTRGVHVKAGDLPQDRSSLGPTHCRPLCFSSELSTNPFCQQEPFSRSVSSGCFLNGLVKGECMGTSTLCNDFQGTRKDFTLGRGSNADSSAMASTTVVHTSSTTGNKSANPTKSRGAKRLREPTGDSLESLMAYTLVADICEQAEAKGFSKSAAKNLIKSWDVGTIQQYDSFWRKYKTHCQAHGIAPFNAQPAQFVNWMSTLLDEGPAAETAKKSLYVVSSIIKMCSTTVKSDYTQLPEVQQLLKSANKVCKPRQPKYRDIYDISLCFEYLHSLFKEWGDDRPFMREVWYLIVLLKANLGWRSDDIAGISRKYGIKKFEKGYELRFWDGKRNKLCWSGFTQVYYLHQDWISLCICSAIDRVLAGIDRLVDEKQIEPETFTVLDFDGKKTQDYSIIMGTPARGAEFISPIKESTIAKKAMELLNAIKDGDDKTLGQKFSAHSFRHAVTSHLRDAKVSMDTIAAHLQTTADSLRDSYSTPVIRAYELPVECMAKTERIQAKILLPYVHDQSSEKDSDKPKPGTCKCDFLFR